MRKICIYHGGCTDGFMAAWLFNRYDGPYEMIPCGYGRPMPKIPDGCYVVIVDFSFKRAELLALRERSAVLMVLDHHKTAMKELEGLHFCIFDETRCGASLAYMHLSLKIDKREMYTVKDAIDYVEDRDLWMRVLPHTEEISAYFASLPHDVKVWDEAILRTSFVQKLGEGTALLRQRRKDVEEHVRRAIVTDGLASVNCTSYSLVSDVCHAMLGTYGTQLAACWMQTKHGTTKYSVRGEGARLYCEARGGGGHDNAAGYEV